MKIQATNIKQCSFEINCPNCSQTHTFEKVNDNTYFLVPDDMDLYNINRGSMWPFFVCKNPSCLFSERLMITNL